MSSLEGVTRKYARFITAPVNANGGVVFDVCTDCGCPVMDRTAHDRVCPPLKPEKAAPVWESARTIADRAWLSDVLRRHVWRVRNNDVGVCSCSGLTRRTEQDYADHLAEIVYRALGGRDE